MRILITFHPGPAEQRLLDEGLAGHEVVEGAPALQGVSAIFGHPDPNELLRSEEVQWVHLSSAGYTPYDRDDLRESFRARGASLTNSSGVYDEPCAEHVLMFMLAHARAFPAALANQIGRRAWPQGEVRSKSSLLRDERVVIVGLGAIGRRVAELLAPLTRNVVAVRRRVQGDEPVATRPIEDLADLVASAKHVVCTLPENPSTRGLFDRRLFERMNAAVFYNVGRGSTVDQSALVDALGSGRVAAAYLDVCTPEPLPPEHPLWTLPNCFITPHSAGGHANESERLVLHFLSNLRRFERGEPLLDRVY
jgi:phosphoglycerate dehydrogenase-like enzyme